MSDYPAPKRDNSIFIVIAGFLLPIAALGFEYLTDVLRAAYFDPVPTPIHYLLIGTVPLANLLMLWNLLSDTVPRRALSWLHSFATGVCAIYAVLFLPV